MNSNPKDEFWVILDDFWVIMDDFWVIMDDFLVSLGDFWLTVTDRRTEPQTDIVTTKACYSQAKRKKKSQVIYSCLSLDTIDSHLVIFVESFCI